MWCAGEFLVLNLPWNNNTRLLLRFFVHLADMNISQGEYLWGAITSLTKEGSNIDPHTLEEAAEEIRNHHSTLDDFISHFFGVLHERRDWSARPEQDAESPFQNPVSNLIYQAVARSNNIAAKHLGKHPGLIAILSIHYPNIARNWCENPEGFCIWKKKECWMRIIESSTAYDSLCLKYCSAMLAENPYTAFDILYHLNLHRCGEFLPDLLQAAEHPALAVNHRSVGLFLEHRSDEVIPIMTCAFAAHLDSPTSLGSQCDSPAYRTLFERLVERWDEGGQSLLMNYIQGSSLSALKKFFASDLPLVFNPDHYQTLRNAIHLVMKKRQGAEQTELWEALAETSPNIFIKDFETPLIGKSKPQREIAAAAIAKLRGTAALTDAYTWLASKRPGTRLGAATLIENIADPSSVAPLLAALEVENVDAVQTALRQALVTCSEEKKAAPLIASGDFDLHAYIKRSSKGLRVPSSSWLVIKSLPILTITDGMSLPEAAVTLLIAKQSKLKEITAAPDILPLLAHIDREKSAPFAAALVEGFLNSQQAAADRWALTLGGLLGDNRIINLLLPRIQGWCENARCKLAEYAAQAISLLPGNEPLMVLDSLSNRYRSKFKNVGRACSEAFMAAATARGITADELADMVVPDFGFDAEGIRRFDWEGGGISAELGADFKLSWFDPETEKSWKSLPANAPDAVKEEVKSVTKLIRETVKAQTARLEMSLVRQRRWPVARWKELFENHPLLRSFASGLVWGVYDGQGQLLRTFRRYANGILADAAGAVEELPETDSMIGMIHPLELTAESLVTWRSHLARMKVKQPFAQLERPVETMDPLHGNRKSINLTESKTLSAGTFRSRAEKRGWARGSVIDAGGISSYYKLYPGAGVEVNLPTDGLYIGCDPMDSITLSAAYFVTAGTVERGSYMYNEPAPDDPRVLRFDQVPVVVFSETLGDLKAIIATKE